MTRSSHPPDFLRKGGRSDRSAASERPPNATGDRAGWQRRHILHEGGVRTRLVVGEICAAEKIPCVETDLSVVDVYSANEMFCTGTMGELAAVTMLDNRQIGDGKVGPVTKRLSDLYAKRTATEGVQIV